MQNVCTKRISTLAALDKWCSITKYTGTHTSISMYRYVSANIGNINVLFGKCLTAAYLTSVQSWQTHSANSNVYDCGGATERASIK